MFLFVRHGLFIAWSVGLLLFLLGGLVFCLLFLLRLCAASGPRLGVCGREGNDDTAAVKHELLQFFVLVLGRIIHVGRLSAENKQRRAAAFAQFVQRLKETLHAHAAQNFQALEERFRAERIGAERGAGRINIPGLKAQFKQSPHAQAKHHQQHGEQHEQRPVSFHQFSWTNLL